MDENGSVYQFITDLCWMTVNEYVAEDNILQKRLFGKMRSTCYEMILRKTFIDFSSTNSQTELIFELISYYLDLESKIKNVYDYKRCIHLKEVISMLKQINFDEDINFHNMLKVIIELQDTAKLGSSPEIRQEPFLFGLLHDMLPKPPRVTFGCVQPYSYFPSYIFKMLNPIEEQSLARDNQKYSSNTQYTVTSSNTRTEIMYLTTFTTIEETNIRSTMIRPFMSSPYKEMTSLPISRNMAYRGLLESCASSDADKGKISHAPLHIKFDIKEIYKNETDLLFDDDNIKKIDKIIAGKENFNKITNVITLETLHSHIKNLIFGIESYSFKYNEIEDHFYVREDLQVEGISQKVLHAILQHMPQVGTYYRRLNRFLTSNINTEDKFTSFIYEAIRKILRQYAFRCHLLRLEKLHYKCTMNTTEETNVIPTLLDTLMNIDPLLFEMPIISSIYFKLFNSKPFLRPMQLFSLLLNEVPNITDKNMASMFFKTLVSICTIYFKFIEIFIFEGNLDDTHNDFFIKKDNRYVNLLSKLSWDSGFYLTSVEDLPDFLHSLTESILLCGKSVRLLKQCNSHDPIVLLTSTEHPAVKCCTSFEELNCQQQILDVYRKRCQFVCGEPATFEQILLKKEAEKVKLIEMATMKRAETMEKIVAEQKRLAQILLAEKQQSLRILQAAMKETQTAKNSVKRRDKKIFQDVALLQEATSIVDTILKDDEKNKLMEYCSQLNSEVEKSEVHMKWKIKRLQMNQSRIKLLSIEEMNLKRKKLKLENQINKVNMATSAENFDVKDVEKNKDISEVNDDTKVTFTEVPVPVSEIIENIECSENIKNEQKKDEKQKHSFILSAMCNITKRVFGNKPKEGNKKCDNIKELDFQGNVVTIDKENNYEISDKSNVIETSDNVLFSQKKKEYVQEEETAMVHDSAQIDDQNSEMLCDVLSFNTKQNKLKALKTEFDIISRTMTPSFNKENNVQNVLSRCNDVELNKLKNFGINIDNPTNVTLFNKENKDINDLPNFDEAKRNKLKNLATEFDVNNPTMNALFYENNNGNNALPRFDDVNRNKLKNLKTELDINNPTMAIFNEENRPKNYLSSFVEAKRNKLKNLATEFDIINPKISSFKEKNNANNALSSFDDGQINKLKNLATECDIINLTTAASLNEENIAKTSLLRFEEAKQNKLKNLATEFDIIDAKMTASFKEKNNANNALSSFDDAQTNKLKNLATDCDIINLTMAASLNEDNIAKNSLLSFGEAKRNKLKNLATEFDIINPKITASFYGMNNANNGLLSFDDAKRNNLENITTGFDTPSPKILHAHIEPKTEAQKEAIRNKNKVLNIEYKTSIGNVLKKEPNKVVEDEVFRNKKNLNSSFRRSCEADKDHNKISLSSKHLSVTNLSLQTLNLGTVTPQVIFSKLGVETPTTPELYLNDMPMNDIFSHNNKSIKTIKLGNSKSVKDSLIFDDFDSIDMKIFSDMLRTKESIHNSLNEKYKKSKGSDKGVINLNVPDSNIFFGKFELETKSTSFYTEPAILFQEMNKKPNSNIFVSSDSHETNNDEEITFDNVRTLKAFLKRSVMMSVSVQLDIVNKSVMTHFLVNLGIYKYFRSLKDYFFFMNGEFSQSICHNLFTKLTNTINPQELLNCTTLQNILVEALGTSISHGHKYSKALSFTISDIPLSFHHSSPDVLSCLSMSYKVDWPLNIILSQNVLLRYGKVFQFLIKMRRVQWVLNEAFKFLKLLAPFSKQYSQKFQQSPQYLSVHLYRHMMASFMMALDNYIVKTRILAAWTQFKDDLKSVRTLDDLYDCHVAYLKNVAFSCLINKRSTPVMKLLNHIFTVILRFTRVLIVGEWEQKEPKGCFTHPHFIELKELFHLFKKLTNYLLKTVTKLTERGYQKHLVELITMINLNGYYNHNEEVNFKVKIFDK